MKGLLQDYYGESYEILNSAVSSYSPGIYYYKTKHLVDNGYVFNKALVFLDISDVIDEMHLSYNLDGTIKHSLTENNNSTKQKIYNIAHYLRENLITFRFLSVLTDKVEILKNYLKDRYYAAKFFKTSFFSINNENIQFFKMLHVDRGNWTQNKKTYQESVSGLKSSEKYLSKLFKLFKKNEISKFEQFMQTPPQKS